jgi:DNA-binding GntR family transcriptional regulator
MDINKQINQAKKITSVNDDIAYSSLRKDIIELRLRPGNIVSIKNLCEHYQINRSPMRDALLRLQEEGLVELLPQSGTMISKIDIYRVKKERFLRMCVEKNVIKLFADNPKEQFINYLKTSVENQKMSIKNKDIRSFLDLDDEFHNVFYEATGNSFCANIIFKVSTHYRRMRLLINSDIEISKTVLSEHCEMINAFENNDTSKIEKLFDNHLDKIGSQQFIFSEKYPDLFINNDTSKEYDSLNNDFFLTL